jgi:hypothetical protein
MPKKPSPSTIAASSRSVGSRLTNCRIRKMLYAPPKKFGTINGSIVFTQPSSRNRMNCGIIVIWAGSIIVASTMKKMIDFPGARIRANAKPTRALENTWPIVEQTAMITEFSRNRPTGNSVLKMSTKLDQTNSVGISENRPVATVAWLDRAIEQTNRNGANRIAETMINTA